MPDRTQDVEGGQDGGNHLSLPLPLPARSEDCQAATLHVHLFDQSVTDPLWSPLSSVNVMGPVVRLEP